MKTYEVFIIWVMQETVLIINTLKKSLCKAQHILPPFEKYVKIFLFLFLTFLNSGTQCLREAIFGDGTVFWHLFP